MTGQLRLAYQAPLLGLSLALAAALFPTPRATADAHPVITVRSPADSAGVCPVDGTVDDDCTLRSAIEAGNATGGFYEILVEVEGTVALTADLPPITESSTIGGLGSDETVISGSEEHRILDVAGDSLTISGITLAEGSHGTRGAAILSGTGIVTIGSDTRFEDGWSGLDGGAIATEGDVVIAGDDVVFARNTAADRHGGAIQADGDVVITGDRVTFEDNSTDEGGAFLRRGGAISAANVTISGEQARFDANSTSGSGGAVWASGDVTITGANAVFDGNRAGAAAVVADRLVISGSRAVFRENDGGGVFVTEAVIVSGHGATFDGNSTGSDGSAITTLSGTVSVTGATIANNTSDGDGGSIMVAFPDGSVSVVNSTFSGNTAGGHGGAIASWGDVEVAFTTFTGNAAGGHGQAVFARDWMEIAASVLADGGDEPVCATLGSIQSLGWNVAEGAWCGLTHPSDQPNTPSAGLGPLADNGGPNQTHALVSGSPAIGVVPEVACIDILGPNPIDQRGMPRPQGSACDSGAFEAGAGDPPPLDGVCPAGLPMPFTDVDPGSVHAGAIACAADHEVAGGFGDGTYRPGRNVNRAQMASFVAGALAAAGYTLPDAEDQGLTDVSGVHTDAINRLVAAGIVGGTTATTFSPAAPVRRAAMASFLVGAVQWALDVELEPESGAHFTDTADNVHETNIDLAFELGLTTGAGPGIYDPGSTVRRAPMASFLVNLLEIIWPED